VSPNVGDFVSVAESSSLENGSWEQSPAVGRGFLTVFAADVGAPEAQRAAALPPYRPPRLAAGWVPPAKTPEEREQPSCAGAARPCRG